MKKYFIFMIMVFIYTSLSFGVIKVMTYNIRHGLGMDDIFDFQRIIDVIKAENPDILMLQEVDQGRSRSLDLKQAEIIAEELGMDYYFYPTEEKDNYGVAIFSKFKSIDKFGFDLPQPKWMLATQRGAAAMVIEVNGEQMLVISTHLGLGGLQEIQTEVLEILNISEKYGLPTLIGGDFNISYFELSYGVKEFLDKFESVNQELNKEIKTFQSDIPGSQIDFIFFSRGDFKILDAYTVNSLASDHLPLVAVIEF